MSYKPNPKQLVLRRDSATGMTLVGWEEDLPVGRFEHLELICESSKNILPDIDSKYYDVWQSALYKARQANFLMLKQQVQQNQSKGWVLVPFELAENRDAMAADRVGSYTAAAMQLHYQLTENRKLAWTVMQHGKVKHVRARYPLRELDEFTYQVWYHKQLHELEKMGGILLEGQLIICESGLWFEEVNDYPLK